MVLGDVGRIMAAGVVIGSVLALTAARGIGAMLFGLNANDMGTLAAATGVLLLAGLLSAAWPARRAAGIDPVTALREG